MKPDVAAGGGGASLSEWTVEAIALDWLESLGWAVAHGPDIAPDTRAAERADYGEVVLSGRLRSALACLNPDLPANALEDAQRRLTRPAGATLEARNRDFHRMVVAGVTVEYVDTDGRVRGAQVRVLDFDEPDANDRLAVNIRAAVRGAGGRPALTWADSGRCGLLQEEAGSQARRGELFWRWPRSRMSTWNSLSSSAGVPRVRFRGHRFFKRSSSSVGPDLVAEPLPYLEESGRSEGGYGTPPFLRAIFDATAAARAVAPPRPEIEFLHAWSAFHLDPDTTAASSTDSSDSDYRIDCRRIGSTGSVRPSRGPRPPATRSSRTPGASQGTDSCTETCAQGGTSRSNSRP